MAALFLRPKIFHSRYSICKDQLIILYQNYGVIM